MIIKYPSRFKIFGINWKIIDGTDYLENKGLYGECSYTEKLIRIAIKAHGIERHSDDIQQTILHEIMHAILHSMNEDELSKNEKFVDIFASIFHQIITTNEPESKNNTKRVK